MTERKRVPGVGPCNAKIMITGMAPAQYEMIQNKPFVGPSGNMLNRALAINGINRNECFINNILEWQIPFGAQIFDNKRTWSTWDEVQAEIDRLEREVKEVKPNVIFALGNDPLQVLTGKRGIVNYRGSILPCNWGGKVVASLHPSGIKGMWKYEKLLYYVDTPRMKQESLSPVLELPTRNLILKPGLTQTLEYLELCNLEEWVAFDIETAWWSEHKMGEISCISFAYKEDEAISIPFICQGGQPYWGSPEEEIVWKGIARLLENKQVKKIAQNGSFDTFYLWKHHVYPYPIVIDTMSLHHCLYPDFGGVEDVTYEGVVMKRKQLINPGHTLRLLTSIYTRTPCYKTKEWDPLMSDEKLWFRNAMDSAVTFEIAMKMVVEAKEDNMWDFFQDHYMSHFYHALRMEWFGIAIDIKKRDAAKSVLVGDNYPNVMGGLASDLQKRINDTLGYELNVASPKQLADLLYKKRGYQVKKKRGTQRVTANKNVLQYFATKRNDPVLTDILALKKCLDEISDVYDVPLTDDNRMQTHYKIGGAAGSRWSSTKSITGSGTNLQNVRRDGIARELYLPT